MNVSWHRDGNLHGDKSVCYITGMFGVVSALACCTVHIILCDDQVPFCYGKLVVHMAARSEGV